MRWIAFNCAEKFRRCFWPSNCNNIAIEFILQVELVICKPDIGFSGYYFGNLLTFNVFCNRIFSCLLTFYTMVLDNSGPGLDCDFASGIELLDDMAHGVKFCKAPEVPGALCDAAKCSTRACVLAVTDLAPGQRDESSRAGMSSRADAPPDETSDAFQC